MVEYYCQRASDVGLIIVEAAVFPLERGNTGTPAIFSDEDAVDWPPCDTAVVRPRGVAGVSCEGETDSWTHIDEGNGVAEVWSLL